MLGSKVAFCFEKNGDLDRRDLDDKTDDFRRENVLFIILLGVKIGLPNLPEAKDSVRGARF